MILYLMTIINICLKNNNKISLLTSNMENIIDMISEKQDTSNAYPMQQNVDKIASSISDDITEQPIIKRNGKAIQGIDYGIDLLESKRDDKVVQEPRQRSARQGKLRPQPFAPSSPSSPLGSLGSGGSQASPLSQASPAGYNLYNPLAPYNVQSNRSLPSSPVLLDMPGMLMEPTVPMYGNDAASSVGDYPGSGLFGQNTRDQLTSQYKPQVQELTYEEIRKRKIDGVAAYRKLKSSGYVPEGHKDITMATSLEEIEDVVPRLKDQCDLDKSILTQRQYLIGFSVLVENICGNDEWNYFELNLDGWSMQITDSISKYDDIFEEFYYKYGGAPSIPVEIRFIGMVGLSGYMFHKSRASFERDSLNVPGFDDIMKNDPELRNRYQQRASEMKGNKTVTPNNTNNDGGGMDVMNMVGGLMKGGGLGGLVGMLGGDKKASKKKRSPRPVPGVQNNVSHQRAPYKSPLPVVPPQPTPVRRTRTRVPMDDPDDVDGLLQSMNNNNNDNDNGLHQEVIDLSEIEEFADLD